MAIRTHVGLAWAMVSTVILWLRAKSIGHVGLSPLSSDWLVDLERKSIRGHN